MIVILTWPRGTGRYVLSYTLCFGTYGYRLFRLHLLKTAIIVMYQDENELKKPIERHYSRNPS